jgi:transcriptional regulator with GAF, ATPase, and Fis domain
VSRICFVDWSAARRDAILVALRTLLEHAEVLDPRTLDPQHVESFTSDTVALIGFSVAVNDAEIEIVRRLCERGCEVIAFADHWDRAPLARRCAALLAGATRILDGARRDFEPELSRRLSAAIEKHDQRRIEQRRVAETMSQFGIVGDSAVMRSLGQWIVKVSPLSDLPVLISGETGTGKELIARAIHGLDPKRRRGPFVALNCAALGASLAESELFGHRRGAFTGASHDRRGLIRSANGGLLFLDEIGDLELGLQAKLLRVLQENRVRGVGEDREDQVNVRVVAATNRDLPVAIEQGRFRLDLLHRLNLLTARAPALSERGDDIEVLVRHFVEKHSDGRRLSPAPSLLAALKAMRLPGNVRQLENLIRHAVVQARDDGALGIEELPSSVWDQLSHANPQPAQEVPSQNWAAVLDSNAWSLAKSLLTCERHFLKAALTRSQGNQSATARLLGVTPRSIYNKLRKHRLAG